MNRLLLSIVFAAWCLGAETAEPLAKEEQVMYSSPNLRIVMDPFFVDVSETSVEFEMKKEGAAAEYVPAGFWVIPTPTTRGRQVSVMIYEKVKDFVDGLYRYRVRVKATSGIESPWSDWYLTRKNWTPPDKPSGCVLIP